MSNQLLLRRRASCISDKRPNYLKFTALEDGSTIALNKVGSPNVASIQYSLNGNEFVDYTFNTSLTINQGETIEFRRNVNDSSTLFSKYITTNYYQFSKSGNIVENGLVTSLLSSDGEVQTIPNFAFVNLFTNSFSINLVFPKTINSIGEYAFYSCKGFIGDLNLTSNINTIGSNAFEDCNRITSLQIHFLDSYLPNNIVRSCSGISNTIIIPNNISVIGNGCFYNCNQISGLILPNELTTIKQQAFTNCSAINGNITIPENVTSIEYGAFYGCNNITSLILSPITPPSLSNTNAIPANKSIYVPYSADHSILNAYKTATNWSTYANQIFELDENGEIPI